MMRCSVILQGLREPTMIMKESFRCTVLCVCLLALGGEVAGSSSSALFLNPLSPSRYLFSRKAVVQQKIVGGVNADVKSFPYQGAVEVWSNGDWDMACGCSVLNHFWSLSAAHCVVDDKVPAHYRLRFGSSRRARDGSVYKVGRVVVHPKYNKSNFDYDVVLFRTERSITLSSVVKPVILGGVGPFPLVGTNLTLSGFGALHDNAFFMSSYLKTVQVTVTDRNQCATKYSKFQQPISNRMFCAYEEKHDACQGDSGGPAVDASGRQVGIISFGEGCAKTGWPGVFVHLGNQEIISFIEENTSGKRLRAS